MKTDKNMSKSGSALKQGVENRKDKERDMIFMLCIKMLKLERHAIISP